MKILVLFGASGRSQPASGPVQSLFAMMDGLNGDFSFKFAASAAVAPPKLANFPSLQWHHKDNIDYFFYSATSRNWKSIKALIDKTTPDLILLNSFFDRDFSIPVLIMRKLHLLPQIPIILSPRGEFARGALSLKSRRKKTFLRLTKMFGLTDVNAGLKLRHSPERKYIS